MTKKMSRNIITMASESTISAFSCISDVNDVPKHGSRTKAKEESTVAEEARREDSDESFHLVHAAQWDKTRLF